MHCAPMSGLVQMHFSSYAWVGLQGSQHATSFYRPKSASCAKQEDAFGHFWLHYQTLAPTGFSLQFGWEGFLVRLWWLLLFFHLLAQMQTSVTAGPECSFSLCQNFCTILFSPSHYNCTSQVLPLSGQLRFSEVLADGKLIIHCPYRVVAGVESCVCTCWSTDLLFRRDGGLAWWWTTARLVSGMIKQEEECGWRKCLFHCIYSGGG